MARESRRNRVIVKVTCPDCHRRIKPAGLKNHQLWCAARREESTGSIPFVAL